MEWMTEPTAWAALATLTALEIVLGIDNIIFISVLSGRLPLEQRPRARTLGLAGAMITRIALLASLKWLSSLSAPLLTMFEHTVTARDLILFGGGMFLLAKATVEIHHNMEESVDVEEQRPGATFLSVITQIMVLDIVFSLDSVITAIGMAEHLPVMIIAIVLAVLMMMVAAGPISDFVEEHPTVKMLALSFLLLVGMALVADGFSFHIPRGYMYFAMVFSVFVELLNLKVRQPDRPVRLRRHLRLRPRRMPSKETER